MMTKMDLKMFDMRNKMEAAFDEEFYNTSALLSNEHNK